MKHLKTTLAAISVFALSFGFSLSGVGAQMMGGVTNTASDDHTAAEEAAGKIIWEKFLEKQKTCVDLSNDDFSALGEYFMGQMLAPSGVEGMISSHEAMNNMMVAMMGKDGEEQMHVVMGKRLSGCNPAEPFPNQGQGYLPMMQMMGGAWSAPFGTGRDSNQMMGFSYGTLGWLAVVGIILWLLWWVAVIVGIIVVIRWLIRRITGRGGRSPLDIARTRYAKGEINQSEFEEIRRALGS